MFYPFIKEAMESKIFKVVLTQDPEDGGYIADVPTLKHCITYGQTVEEAMQNVQEILEGVLKVMQEHGDEIPDDSDRIEYNLTVPVRKSNAATAVHT